MRTFLCRFKKIDKIRKLIGSRSSARKNVESDGISDSSIDRFTDLQEAVDCIDMTGPDSIEPKEWPTLGHLLSVQPKYIHFTHSLIEIQALKLYYSKKIYIYANLFDFQ